MNKELNAISVISALKRKINSSLLEESGIGIERLCKRGRVGGGPTYCADKRRSKGCDRSSSKVNGRRAASMTVEDKNDDSFKVLAPENKEIETETTPDFLDNGKRQVDHIATSSPFSARPPMHCTQVNNASEIVKAFLSGQIEEADPLFSLVDLPMFVQEHPFSLKFPEKLMLILAYVNRGQNSCIPSDELHYSSTTTLVVSWVHRGKAIKINDKEEFVEGILPLFSLHEAKFESFIRKLYRWRFRKGKDTPHAVASKQKGHTKASCLTFWNPNFVRHDRKLLCKMERRMSGVESSKKNDEQSISSRVNLLGPFESSGSQDVTAGTTEAHPATKDGHSSPNNDVAYPHRPPSPYSRHGGRVASLHELSTEVSMRETLRVLLGSRTLPKLDPEFLRAAILVMNEAESAQTPPNESIPSSCSSDSRRSQLRNIVDELLDKLVSSRRCASPHEDFLSSDKTLSSTGVDSQIGNATSIDSDYLRRQVPIDLGTLARAHQASRASLEQVLATQLGGDEQPFLQHPRSSRGHSLSLRMAANQSSDARGLQLRYLDGLMGIRRLTDDTLAYAALGRSQTPRPTTTTSSHLGGNAALFRL